MFFRRVCIFLFLDFSLSPGEELLLFHIFSHFFHIQSIISSTVVITFLFFETFYFTLRISDGIMQKTYMILHSKYYIMIPLQGVRVSRGDGQWTKEMSLQVRDLTQWAVRELQLYNNGRAALVREIAHIHFTALSYLNLGGNRVDSIEGLCRVQMPHLCDLLLWHNCITSVGVMRKAAWPALQLLNIGSNRFGDGKSLAVGFFPHMQNLILYFTWGADTNTFIEQCFVGKMQAVSLTHLYIRENKLCCDRSLTRALKQRWQGIQIG